MSSKYAQDANWDDFPWMLESLSIISDLVFDLNLSRASLVIYFSKLFTMLFTIISVSAKVCSGYDTTWIINSPANSEHGCMTIAWTAFSVLTKSL